MTPVTSLHDRQRQAARELAAELTDTLAMPPPTPPPGNDCHRSHPRWKDQSLSQGAAGIAVLHGVSAQHPRDRVHRWLARATRDALSVGRSAGLWFGAPAVAFAATVAAPGQYPHTTASLDAAVARVVTTRLEAATARMAAAARPSLSEFDLVRGLTGLGAYLLHRDPHGGLVRRVLAYLVRLTQPIPTHDPAGAAAPGWWSSDPPPGQTRTAYPGGHTDLGVAHGIAGPLSLLALAQRHGTTVDGHAVAIDSICRWLDAWRQETPTGPWWPERISLAELRAGRPLRHRGPARPSWCYGTPGLARAQQLAGIALGDRTRQRHAEHALTRCLADPAQLARIVDPSLCHGWAGLIATVRSAAADATSADLDAHLPRLLDLLLASRGHTAGTPLWQRPGLIDGRAGVALLLHHVTSTTGSSWQRCLLLN